MDERPAFFETVETALVSLGEETGRLDEMFAWLAGFFEQRYRDISRATGQAIYPLMVMLIAVLILPLPLLARGQRGAYVMTTILGVGAWLASAGTAFAALIARAMRKPHLVRARLARALATATGAGLPLDRIVNLGVAAADHPCVSAHVATMSVDRIRSQPLSRTFTGCPYVPVEMLAAMRVAEQTGDYRTTLTRLAQLYEDGFA
jgi:type II secretory pathway component PulF